MKFISSSRLAGAPGRRFPRLIGAVLLATSVALSACSSTASGPSADKKYTKDDVVMVTFERSVDYAYGASWVDGATKYADEIGVEHEVALAQGDSNKQLSQIQSIIAQAKQDGKIVLVMGDPAASADVPAIAQAVKAGGGYLVTGWNKPDDVHPWDFGNSWVAHADFDGVEYGERGMTNLANSIGGKGGVVLLAGVLDNPPQKQRKEGALKALKNFPDVKVIDEQVTNWDRNQSYDAAKKMITKHGADLKGFFGANDDIATGAAQAVKESGLEDKIKVVSASDGTPEAVDLLKSGDLVSSTFIDPWYFGAWGLAMGLAAATGELDVAKLTKDQREVVLKGFPIDKDNVAQYENAPTGPQIKAELDKGLYDRVINAPAPTK